MCLTIICLSFHNFQRCRRIIEIQDAMMPRRAEGSGAMAIMPSRAEDSGYMAMMVPRQAKGSGLCVDSVGGSFGWLALAVAASGG